MKRDLIVMGASALYHRLADRTEAGRTGTASRFQERAENRDENARVLRDFLVHVNRGTELEEAGHSWPESEVR